MLEIKELQTGYGNKQVIFNLTLELKKGEIVAMIGPNGAGKSTVLKAVCGLIPIWKGEIYFNRSLINGFTPGRNASQGIYFVPQGNRIFDELTVRENLEIGGFLLSNKRLKRRINDVLELFPILKYKLRHEAGKLSAGEQQMLAIARALIPEPRLLMLDEPSLGLSLSKANTLFKYITKINRDIGISVLIVEQKVREVLEICHRVYGIKLGKIDFWGSPIELKKDRQKLKELFL